MQCIITTGCSKITGDLVGSLEIAMRRDISKPRLPAVKNLSMRDMANLRRAICKQTSVDKEEEYFYYSIVNIQDFNPDIPEITPLGPNKEGPLMFKTSDTEARWETAYFILKAGVLYMLSSASQRVPMRVFPLINGSCQGAQRVFNCPRPHTFQLMIEGKTLHLAAPDEYVASDWLQCLVHAASGGYNQREKMLTQSCSLLMTTDHILTVREAFPCTISSLLPSKNQHQPIKGPQVLSCAAIVDLIAFRLPSAEQSWCVLEFSCREVHECSGDWILYFATNVELENFISTLEILWAYNNENGDSFPLSTIPETDPLSKKCVDIYTSLKQLWPSNTVHLQFL
jgi:pleckstrin family protein M 2